MKSVRLALALTAAATLAGGALLSASADAATGDTWSGFQVVDVTPAATTQTAVLGMLPRYKVPGPDLYLWNIVRMVKDKNGHESWVFCIQAKQMGDAPDYSEDPVNAGTTEGRANAEKINRVLADSKLPAPGAFEVTNDVNTNEANPAVDVLPKHKADHIEMTAIQLALWHFTDGYDFNTNNTIQARDFYSSDYVGDAEDATMADVLARYDELVASANANPLANPDPQITITPASKSSDAGAAVIFTVAGKDIDGGISLASDNADVTLYKPGAGDACDTSSPITSLPSSGGEVCVTSTTANFVTVTAKGSSRGNATHSLYALDAQSLISTGSDEVSDSATATWTAVQQTETPSTTPSDTASETPSDTASESVSATVSATESTGGAVVVSSSAVAASEGNANANADTPGDALASTGPIGLLSRLLYAIGAVAIGALLVSLTGRRPERSH